MNTRRSQATIGDLTPGQEYLFSFSSESDYGKESVQLNLTRSILTGDVINYVTSVASDEHVEISVEIASGVGKYVTVDLSSDDYPTISRSSFYPFE